jgi:hypothetical protein
MGQTGTRNQRCRVTGPVIRITPPDTDHTAAQEIEKGTERQSPMHEHEHKPAAIPQRR